MIELVIKYGLAALVGLITFFIGWLVRLEASIHGASKRIRLMESEVEVSKEDRKTLHRDLDNIKQQVIDTRREIGCVKNDVAELKGIMNTHISEENARFDSVHKHIDVILDVVRRKD